MECLLLLLTQQQPAGHRRLRTDRMRRTTGRRAHTAATFRNGSVAASFLFRSSARREWRHRETTQGPHSEQVTGVKTKREALSPCESRGRTARDHSRKKGGQRKTAARPFGIKTKSEVPIPRINPNRTNAREPGEDDRRARGLNSREHGPGHGKNQCFTLPSASGLCLYLKTIAKTTPTTRA